MTHAVGVWTLSDIESEVALLATGLVTEIRADLDQALQSRWSQVQRGESSQQTRTNRPGK